MNNQQNDSFKYFFIPISILGLLCCPNRSDYNVILGIFSYYLWSNTQISQKHRILWLNIISLIGDLTWILFISIGQWGQHPDSNNLKSFTQLISIINMIYKIALIVYASNWIKECDKLFSLQSFIKKVLFM